MIFVFVEVSSLSEKLSFNFSFVEFSDRLNENVGREKVTSGFKFESNFSISFVLANIWPRSLSDAAAVVVVVAAAASVVVAVVSEALLTLRLTLMLTLVPFKSSKTLENKDFSSLMSLLLLTLLLLLLIR